MSKNKYPRGWNEARIRKVIEYYDSQTEEDDFVCDFDAPLEDFDE